MSENARAATPDTPTPYDVDAVARAFLNAALEKIRRQKSLADRAIVQTTDDALHRALDSETNSIAVIMQHVAGNLMSRWTEVFSTDGEKPTRDRDAEFIDQRLSREALAARWEAGWQCFIDAVAALTPSDVLREIRIRGEAHTVIAAILRAIEHNGYHVGQIVQLARHFARGPWTTLTIPRGGSQVK